MDRPRDLHNEAYLFSLLTISIPIFLPKRRIPYPNFNYENQIKGPIILFTLDGILFGGESRIVGSHSPGGKMVDCSRKSSIAFNQFKLIKFDIIKYFNFKSEIRYIFNFNTLYL